MVNVEDRDESLQQRLPRLKKFAPVDVQAHEPLTLSRPMEMKPLDVVANGEAEEIQAAWQDSLATKNKPEDVVVVVLKEARLMISSV